MNKLSIIIINFNSGNYLKNCIESIKKSSLPEDKYEIIIIDNSSNDESLQSINEIQIRNLKIIRNTQNIGFAKANNIGIKQSSGQYILLLNPDTIVEGDTLENLINYMDKTNQVGVATCKVVLPNGSLDDASHRGFPTPWNAFCHFIGIGRLFPHSQIFNGYHMGFCQLDKIHEIDSCVGAFMMIRRITGEKTGWLDEDYFWYGEDLDFCFKVKLNGWKVIYNPMTKITHFKGITSGIKSHSKHISQASPATKKLATKSRFEVMRIFYMKHYINVYPKFITNLVLLGIEIKSKITMTFLR